MYIVYGSQKWKQICTNPKKACKYLSSQELVNILLERLSQLDAYSTLEHVLHTPPIRRHKLKGKRKGEWAVSVSKQCRICFKPIGRFEEDASGNPLLHTVTEIEITFIGDYHNG